MSEEDHTDHEDLEVPGQVHTVCHLCAGDRTIPILTLAVVGGVPRTLDIDHSCPACHKEGQLPGLVPPV